MSETPYYPQTLGDFIKFYEDNQPSEFSRNTKQFPYDNVALQSVRGKLSFGDLLDFKNSNINKLYGLNIAISLNCVQEGLKLIVAADTVCNSITIIPSSLNKDHKIKILQTVSSSHYFGEDADEFNDKIPCQFFKNINAIENEITNDISNWRLNGI